MDGDALSRFCKRKRARHEIATTPVRGRYQGSALLCGVVGRENIVTWPLVDDLVTVSVPVYRTPAKLLSRALTSLLAQSHKHVRIVVIADGDGGSFEGLPEDLRNDRRIVYVASPTNHGPYFNHDVVLRASKGPFFAIQDADDESRVERFDTQLRGMFEARPDAIYSAVRNVFPDGRTSTSRPGQEIGPTLAHRSDHFGLFATASLLELGGYHGGFRVGFDTVITSSLMILGRVVHSDAALYVRHVRSGSLTTAVGTGHGSMLRRQQKEDLADFHRAVWDASVTSRLEGIREHVRAMELGARPVQALRKALVDEVRGKIEEQGIVKPPASPALVAAVYRAAPASDWAITRDLAIALYRHCEKTRPKRIVEVGSGVSTMMLALYAARHRAEVITLEHDPKWLARTLEALRAVGLDGAVKLVLRRVRSYDSYHWYEYDPKAELRGKPIDFLLVDGPPDQLGHGRVGALLHLRSALRKGAEVWLHDGKRESERQAVIAWRKAGISFSQKFVDHHDPRGLWQLKLR